MNVTDITRKAQRLFGDSADEIIMTQPDIYDWINEAQLQIVRTTHCLTKSTTQAASTFPLALPADWIQTKRLTYNGIPLKYINIDDLNDLYIDPSLPVDSPLYFYIVAKTIRLYPAKGATDATATVHDYVAAPTTIIAVGTALDTPISYHEDIVRFCVMRAHERNENYKAQEISKSILDEYVGIRLEEATVMDDEFYVVRDDLAEDW